MELESAKPRKQRLARYEAPLHMRRHYMAVHLSKELRQKLAVGRRSMPVVKGDRVKIMRGRRKGTVGKITEVDLTSCKVYVEGIGKSKARGTEVLVPVEPSNLLLLDGDFNRKGRKEVIDRTRAKEKTAAKEVKEVKQQG